MLGSSAIFDDLHAYLRVFAWVPLALWLWAVQSGRRWPFLFTVPLTPWPVLAVVQVWRPIRHPVEREPLAIADARSIGIKELFPSSRVYPDRVGEVYHCAYNPQHRWYYFP